MPRAQGAQPVVGGQVNPVVTEQIARSKQFAEQRAQLAFQQKQESTRAGLASQTQLATTAMEAGSRERVAGIQQSGATQRTAMQMGAEDRRVAMDIRNSRENREFMGEQQKERIESDAKHAQMLEKFNMARETRDVGRAKEAQDFEIELKKMDIDMAFRNSLTNAGTTFGMLKLMSGKESDRAKIESKILDMTDRYEQEQEELDSIRTGIKESLGMKLDTTVPTPAKFWIGGYRGATSKQETIIDDELSKYGTDGLTLKSMSLGNYSALEDLVSRSPQQGGLGVGQLKNLELFISTAKERIVALKDKTDDESDKKFYVHLYDKIDEAEKSLGKLRHSSNKEVAQKARNAWDSVHGHGISAAASKLRAQTGNIDLNAWTDIIKKMYSTPYQGKSYGPFSEMFDEQQKTGEEFMLNLLKE